MSDRTAEASPTVANPAQTITTSCRCRAVNAVSPSRPSGGRQQRVAIARALVTRPEAIFADEPTGALDTGTGRQVLRLLRDLVDAAGQTVVLVTHDPVAASFADRVVFLADGRLAGSLEEPSADAIAERMARLGQW
jgi:putative ABC transport system ATP-binding protein